MKSNEIKLGNTYKDVITGFAGVAVGWVKYISGCNQTLLTPKAKAGVRLDSEWFDDQRLESVKAKRINIDNGVAVGCDIEAPKR